jgi:hypothetical protein
LWKRLLDTASYRDELLDFVFMCICIIFGAAFDFMKTGMHLARF